MLILTNFQRFPEHWRATDGRTGTALRCTTVKEFLRASWNADLVIINCDVNLTLRLNFWYFLLPFLRRPILAHDIVLRRPKGQAGEFKTWLKKQLFRRIDHFTHHFTLLEPYERYFGIGPARSSYLPSKPNIRYRYEYKVGPEGDYVLCFGRSDRDYDSFFEAMEKLPDVPGAIPPPNYAQFAKHTAKFSRRLEDLPENVRVLEDDGSVQSLIGLIEKARLVVLPTLKTKISPSGIGTYLNAMLMGKCVIISRGPAVSDVLKDEVLMVDPEDPQDLERMIRRAWDGDELRLRVAAAGQRYSESCGGEPELRQRVLDRALEKLAPKT